MTSRDGGGGESQGRIRLLLIVMLGIAAVLCAANRGSAAGSGSGALPTVRIGSTNFTEQLIVAELYGQVLEAHGYTVVRRLNLGNREIVAPALESGQIDLVPEYLATYLTYITKDKSRASADPVATRRNLQEALTPRHLTVLDHAPAVDTNGFVVTKETAGKYQATRLSDLAPVAGQLVLGAPPECPDRPFCIPGLRLVYGITFKDFKALDAGGPLTVAALAGKQVDVALLFTTDAVIAAKGLVLLQDDRRLQLADNIAPVVRDDLLAKAPADFRSLLDGVTAKITTEEITALNRMVGLDKQDPRAVAGAWLKQKGLVK
jgi:osmoprotectant transport system substrate-binding protein